MIGVEVKAQLQEALGNFVDDRRFRGAVFSDVVALLAALAPCTVLTPNETETILHAFSSQHPDRVSEALALLGAGKGTTWGRSSTRCVRAACR